MSIWKQLEYLYIEDEKNFGYNKFWWSVWALTEFSTNNKNLYRTMLRTTKNRNRKLKVLERKKRK